MILKEMWLANYRGITKRHVKFNENGITLIVGPNEAGKSSLIEALDMLFEELDSSTKQRVKGTQPVGQDVATEITLHAASGPYDFTYSKHFHRDKRTELTIHAPRVERLSGRDAHNRVKAILEETMDDCLWKALRIQQGSGITQADLVGSHSLKNALDVAAGGTANAEQESDLYSLVKRESETYYTETGGERADLKRAKAEYEDLQTSLRQAEAKLEAIEQDVNKYASLEESAKRLQDAKVKETSELVVIADQLTNVDTLEHQIEAISAERDKAQLSLENYRLKAVGRKDKIDGLKRIETALADVIGEKERLLELITQLQMSSSQAMDTVTGLKKTVEAQQITTDLYKSAVQYLEDKTLINQITKRLKQASQARADMATLSAAIREIVVDDKALKEIRTKHTNHVTAKAALETKAPQVRITAIEDSEVRIGSDLFNLEQGQERAVKASSVTTIEVPGRIQIEVTPGTSLADLQHKSKVAEKELGDALARYHVESLADAEEKLQLRRDAESKINEAAIQMKAALDNETIDELQEQESRLADGMERFKNNWPSDVPVPDDLKQAQAVLADAIAELANMSTLLAKAERDYDKAIANINGQSARLADIETRHQTLIVDRDAEIKALEEARSKISDIALTDAAATAQTDVDNWNQELTALGQTLANLQPDLLRERHTNLLEKTESIDADIERTNNHLFQLRGRLDTTEADGTYEKVEDLRSRLRNQEMALSNLRSLAGAARHLYVLMRDAREEAIRSYRKPLCDRIAQLGQAIYGPSFDVQLSPELTVSERILGNTPIPYDSLSAGAKEQLALLTRIAAAELVNREEGVPVILDDALGFSDEHRLEWLGAILQKFGQDRQTIILTCTPERYRMIHRPSIIDFGASDGTDSNNAADIPKTVEATAAPR